VGVCVCRFTTVHIHGFVASGNFVGETGRRRKSCRRGLKVGFSCTLFDQSTIFARAFYVNFFVNKTDKKGFPIEKKYVFKTSFHI
jgi:hypothetical protein